MCGIAGIISADPHARRPIFDLTHRGPDGENWFSARGENWGGHLYHTRLAINDLSDAGSQPMVSGCGSGLTLAFNGEIYNSPELRRQCESRGHIFQSEMDGEVILHLFEDYGDQAFAKLNGIFSISLLAEDGTLILSRDEVGAKPLFYRTVAEGVAFASEPGQLIRLSTGASWDIPALASFLTFLWIPAPRSPWTEVHSLRPGEVLHWRPDQPQTVTVQRGAHALVLPEDLDPFIGPDTSGEAVGGILERAVGRQLLSDVPVGVMASGGVDSTLLWWLGMGTAEVGFTIAESPGMEGLDEDVQAAGRFASDFGLEHHVLALAPDVLEDFPKTGDLIADPAFSLTRSITHASGTSGIRVLLSGQGADEVMGGYRRHTAADLMERVPRSVLFGAGLTMSKSRHPIRAEYGRRMKSAATARSDFWSYSELYRYSDSATRARILDVTEREVFDEVVFEEHRRVWESMPNSWSLPKKAVTLDLMVYLPGLGLAYVDRASMSNGVEVRVPWLDDEMVEWSLAQDARTLTSPRSRKRAARSLSANLLPEYIWNRPKVGFGVAAERLQPSTSHDRATQRHDGYLNHCTRVLLEAGFPVFGRDQPRP